MSSFLFLTFCVYVFRCLGLHFSAVPLSNPFFRWLFTRVDSRPTWFVGILMQRNPVLFRRKRRILRIQGLLSAVALATAAHTASTGGRSGASLVSFSLPCPQNRTQGCTGPSFGFLSRTSLPLPPKGGGAGYHLTWLAGILMQRSPVLFRRKRRMLRIRGLLSAVVCGNCRPQPGYVGPTGLVWCFAGVVSLPGSQNRTQGRTGPSLVFSPQNELTPPPKGGRGGVSSFLGWSGWPCSFTTGPQRPNRAGL